MRRRLWDLLGLGSLLVFATVLALLLRSRPEAPPEDVRLLDPSADIQTGEEWLGLYFQGRKVGTTHVVKAPRPGGGHRFTAETRLAIAPGAEPMEIEVRADLDAARALRSFALSAEAGPSVTEVRGTVDGRHIDLVVDSGGAERRRTLELEAPPVLRQFDGPYLAGLDPKPGARFSYLAFDPVTQSAQPVEVEVIGPDRLVVMSHELTATRVRQRVSGVTLEAWINARGEVLRQEMGLGLIAVREFEEEARRGVGRETVDLAAATTIPVEGLPPRLDRAVRLDVVLEGLDDEAGFTLDDGHRQRREGDRLWVRLEDASAGGPLAPGDAALAPFLSAAPLVEADHPDIRAAAADAAAGATDTLDASRRIVAWIRRHVSQETVGGVPGALETLRTRAGDCNEHGALFAALARAAGVPTRIVAGLAYRDGRFSYHAWNEVWAGGERWVAVDATWGQVPADVGHLRFVTGGLDRQVDLLRLMGRLRIRVLALEG